MRGEGKGERGQKEQGKEKEENGKGGREARRGEWNAKKKGKRQRETSEPLFKLQLFQPNKLMVQSGPELCYNHP